MLLLAIYNRYEASEKEEGNNFSSEIISIYFIVIVIKHLTSCHVYLSSEVKYVLCFYIKNMWYRSS